jgi:hypothetical protein
MEGVTAYALDHPDQADWDVVSVDCIFGEMFIAKGSQGEYVRIGREDVRLGQQLGPESPRADSTY